MVMYSWCDMSMMVCTSGDVSSRIGNYASVDAWVFCSGLGELRGVFGLCLRDIVLACKNDLESELASIIPSED